MAKFTGKTVKGEEYCLHTETGDQNRVSMESLEHTIHDAGDFSQCKKKVLSVGTWPAEMV